MEEWPYPEEVVRKLLHAKKLRESILAHRAAERLAFEEYRRTVQQLLSGGVGVKAVARVMACHPSTIREVARGRKPQNGE